jgi:TIR domain
MDIDAIPVGLDFREHIQETLDRCDILLAVIGPRWAGTQEDGQPRIADEADWVRLEIEAALAKKIPVIPALIDRSRMPKATELPESLRPFAFRQAADIDSSRDFHAHMDRLIRSMDGLLARKVEAPAPAAKGVAPAPAPVAPRQVEPPPKRPPPVAKAPPVQVKAEPAPKPVAAEAKRPSSQPGKWTWAFPVGVGAFFILLGVLVGVSTLAGMWRALVGMSLFGFGALVIVLGIVKAARQR